MGGIGAENMNTGMIYLEITPEVFRVTEKQYYKMIGSKGLKVKDVTVTGQR